MEKAEQHIQREDICNAPIFLDWNGICNADMNELYAIVSGEENNGTRDS